MFKRGWGGEDFVRKRIPYPEYLSPIIKIDLPSEFTAALLSTLKDAGVHLLKTHAVWEQLSRQFIELPETFRNCTLTSIKAPTMQFPYVQATYFLKIEGYFFCCLFLFINLEILNK